MKRISVLLLCLSALSGCTEFRISRELKAFMEETIIVPSDLVQINVNMRADTLSTGIGILP